MIGSTQLSNILPIIHVDEKCVHNYCGLDLCFQCKYNLFFLILIYNGIIREEITM